MTLPTLPMNLWQMAAVGVIACLVPCAWMTLRGSPERRLVGFEMTGLIVTLALVILTIAFGRLPFIDLALTAAVMSLGSGLVFARFLGKHL